MSLTTFNDVTIEEHFTREEFASMSSIEKQSYTNMKENYVFLKKLGKFLDIKNTRIILKS